MQVPESQTNVACRIFYVRRKPYDQSGAAYHVFSRASSRKTIFIHTWLAALHVWHRSQNCTTSLSSLFSKSNFFENMNAKRFVAFETSLQDHVGSMAYRNSRVKTKRDVQLFEELLRKEEKVNKRLRAHTMAPKKLIEYLRLYLLW